MKIVKVIAWLLVGLMIAVDAAYLLPNSASVTRSLTIDRPASMIYPLLDGFGRFNEWSPWFGLDPKAVYTYKGPAHGVGASTSWTSLDPTVRSGTQTISAVVANQGVTTDLDFGDMGLATSQHTLTAQGASTQVTWAFASELPIHFDRRFFSGVMGRYCGLLIDKFVGPSLETGLANLKKVVERMPNVDIAGLEVTEHVLSAQPSYFVSTKAATDAASSAAALGQAYGEILAFVGAKGLRDAGPPYALIQSHANGEWMFDAGIPVDRNDLAPTGVLRAGATIAGKVVDFKHFGSYDALADSHAKANAWLAAYGMQERGSRAEIYVSDPDTTKAETLLTLIRVPVN